MKKQLIILMLGIFSLGCSDKGIDVIPFEDSNDLGLKVNGRYTVATLQYKNTNLQLPSGLINARMSVVRLTSDKVDLYLSIYEGVVRTDYILFQNADLFENPDKSISFNQGTENVGTLVNKDLTLTKIADTNKIRFWITANR